MKGNDWEEIPLLKTLKQSLDKIFGEERYDIWDKESKDEFLKLTRREGNQYNYLRDSEIICIHYPSVTVKNSRGNHRELEDIYALFSINISKNQVVSTPYSGAIMRTTVTKQEYAMGFCHPHGGGIGQFGGTCWGQGGQPIQKTFAKVFGGKNPTPEQIQSFFNAFKAHLEWENDAEGYNLLSEINHREGRSTYITSSRASITFIKNLIKSIDKEVLMEHVKVMKDKNGLVVLPTPNLELLLGELLKDDRNYTCIKGASCYYAIGEISKKEEIGESIIPYGRNNMGIIFKGKKVPVIIKKSIKNNNDTEIICSKPDVTEKFCKELTKMVRKQLAKGKTSKRKSTTDNKAKASKSDTASV